MLQLAIDDGYGAGFALGFATDSFADLILALNQGDIYIDMHTELKPSGEIRGQFGPAVVPEPSTFALLALGIMVAAFLRRSGDNESSPRCKSIATEAACGRIALGLAQLTANCVSTQCANACAWNGRDVHRVLQCEDAPRCDRAGLTVMARFSPPIHLRLSILRRP